MFYSFGRFWLEFLRYDQSKIIQSNLNSLDVNQLVMVILFAGALAWLIIRHVQQNKKQTVQIEPVKASKAVTNQSKEPVQKTAKARGAVSTKTARKKSSKEIERGELRRKAGLKTKRS